MTDGVLTAEARLEQLLHEIRTMGMVAGQAALEVPDLREAEMSGHFANFCSRWSDELESILSRWRSAHGSREAEPCSDCRELRATLKMVLRSAFPHPINHPSMTAAWRSAHHLLDELAQRTKAHGSEQEGRPT